MAVSGISLIQKLQKLFGARAVSDMMGRTTNVQTLAQGTNNPFARTFSRKYLAKNEDGVEEASRVILENMQFAFGNKNIQQMKNFEYNVDSLYNMKFPPKPAEAKVVNIGTKKQVTGEGLESLKDDLGLPDDIPPTSPLGESITKAKREDMGTGVKDVVESMFGPLGKRTDKSTDLQARAYSANIESYRRPIIRQMLLKDTRINLPKDVRESLLMKNDLQRGADPEMDPLRLLNEYYDVDFKKLDELEGIRFTAGDESKAADEFLKKGGLKPKKPVVKESLDDPDDDIPFAQGGRAGFKFGGSFKQYINREDKYKDLNFEEWLREDKASGGIAGQLHLNQGGRVGFQTGGMNYDDYDLTNLRDPFAPMSNVSSNPFSRETIMQNIFKDIEPGFENENSIARMYPDRYKTGLNLDYLKTLNPDEIKLALDNAYLQGENFQNPDFSTGRIGRGSPFFRYGPEYMKKINRSNPLSLSDPYTGYNLYNELGELESILGKEGVKPYRTKLEDALMDYYKNRMSGDTDLQKRIFGPTQASTPVTQSQTGDASIAEQIAAQDRAAATGDNSLSEAIRTAGKILDPGKTASTAGKGLTTIYSGTTAKDPFGGSKFFATPDLETAKTYATDSKLRGSAFSGPVTGKVLQANVPTSQVDDLLKKGLTGTREVVLDPQASKALFEAGEGILKGSSSLGTRAAVKAARAIPVAGTGLALTDAASRLKQGDYVGAGLGVASALPVAGLPFLGAQMAYDQRDKIAPYIKKFGSALGDKMASLRERRGVDPRMAATYEQNKQILGDPRMLQASGGRVGLKKGGPPNPGRRNFMKLMAGLASIPVLGKFFKPAKVAKTIIPIKNASTAMPEWFPNFVDKFIHNSIGKKIDADLMEFKNPDLPNIKVTRSDDGRVFVEGNNEYNEGYAIDYTPPGYELVDETTGKAVRTHGEFEAVEGRHVAVGPEDYDTDPFYVDDLDELTTIDVAEMEKYTTGKVTKTVKDAFGTDTKLKKGVRDYDMAVGKAENEADVLKDADLLDEDLATGGRVGLLSGGGVLKVMLKKLAKERGMSGSEMLAVMNYKALPSKIKNLMSPEQFQQLKDARLKGVKNFRDMMQTTLDFDKSVKAGKAIDERNVGLSDLFDFIEESYRKKSVVPKNVTEKDILQMEQMIKNMELKGRKPNAKGGLAGQLL